MKKSTIKSYRVDWVYSYSSLPGKAAILYENTVIKELPYSEGIRIESELHKRLDELKVERFTSKGRNIFRIYNEDDKNLGEVIIDAKS